MPLIAVLMGGDSAEREISLQTGAGVASALERLGYRTITLDFDHRFVDELRAAKPDAVFNALHGGAGEDGTVPAILDWLGLPYQGSGVRASAAAMDKWTAKALMRAADLPTPRAVVLELRDAGVPAPPKRPQIPCVVKPQAEGSAVGVSIVHTEAEWAAAIATAVRVSPRVMVEEYVRGREFTVAILGDQALPIVEIAPTDEFYTYHAKYTPGASKHIVPANLDPALSQTLADYALRLHRLLGCRDYSRVDAIVDASDASIYLLECNTLPGLTDLSLYPDAARAAGIGYDQLVDRLVKAALSRAGVGAS
ncbi:MAG TPA: D-alanine--D-alanine ligase [Candidatus Eremiobacteraceae bacterium]|nr:D-alanine--D-alanine ligase [Candidatus Eremiobacteraceae bacterium]